MTGVRRGLLYAAVAAALSVAINQGDAILQGRMTGGMMLRMSLTVVVILLVPILSSLQKASPQRKQRKTEGRRISEEH